MCIYNTRSILKDWFSSAFLYKKNSVYYFNVDAEYCLFWGWVEFSLLFKAKSTIKPNIKPENKDTKPWYVLVSDFAADDFAWFMNPNTAVGVDPVSAMPYISLFLNVRERYHYAMSTMVKERE